MKLFHSTTPEAAAAILKEGFRDTTGQYLTTESFTGVWFSDVPLDEGEGAKGNELLAIEAPDARLAEWEWIEEGKPYREFLLPADVANRFGPPVMVDRYGL
ncbi:MAG: hypothetical protein AMXMBFR13_50550 [Phycisphaerae bacterium]